MNSCVECRQQKQLVSNTVVRNRLVSHKITGKADLGQHRGISFSCVPRFRTQKTKSESMIGILHCCYYSITILLHSFCRAVKFPLSRVTGHPNTRRTSSPLISVHETVHVSSPLLDLRLLNPINCVYRPVLAA